MLNLVIGECSSLVGVELDILDKKEDLENATTGTVLNRYCVNMQQRYDRSQL
jgi:hypothetical protein